MSLRSRVMDLESAVLALAVASLEEFGDLPGHEFHGNQWTTGSGRTLNDHLIKGRTENEIVQEGKRRGLVPEGQTPGYSEYGGMGNRTAILPTQTKIHVLKPEENPYGHRGDSYLVVHSSDTGHLRAIGGSGDMYDHALGDRIYFQHDQTMRPIGQGPHQIVGIVHGGSGNTGTVEGVIPDRKIAYSVFK